MHELLLFGQVPAKRRDQLVQILAGVSGMQPQRVIERHLVYKPYRTPGQRGHQVGGSQGIQNAQAQALQGQLHGDLFYLHLVAEVEDGHFGTENPTAATSNEDADTGIVDINGQDPSEDVIVSRRHTEGTFQRSSSDSTKQSWALRFSDLPEVAGRRPVTSRLISGVDIIDGNPFNFMDSLGYTYVTEYVLEGHRVVHKNLILLLHRILRLQGDSTGSLGPKKQTPSPQSLAPLDPSDAYILQASVRVQDGNKPESMTLGINELRGFKELMKGVLDMEVGDRLALDTRVKS
ncbi:MAG: Mediator of RNA polymerase II transcription subunit 18 [Pycnora praestabilis]|nr:MAG: Mediator of RNA polymerase II transcription subunit 18 [Pycnora praestabilis]